MSRPTDIVGMPQGTKCQRIIRLRRGWMVWIATTDYVHGTYLILCDSGEVVRVTAREDEGDEMFVVRPADHSIEQVKSYA